MSKDNKILIAKVLSPFGIKGQVKLLVFSNEPLNLEKYPLFDQNNQKISVKFTNKNKTPVKFSNQNPIMIATINDAKYRDEAENLRKCEIYINKEDLDDLADNEYYYNDLIGLDVVNNENKEKIGKILNVLDYGAGPIVSLKFNKKPEKSLYQEEEFFAFKDEIFPEVDIANNKIFINLPEFVKVD